FNRVWIPDPEDVWKSAEILKDFKPGENVLDLQLEDGMELKYPLELGDKDLPPLRNPDILVGENDLTALSYLHEPAVLHNLKVRFVDSKIIYTYCGIILVAINPYKQLPIYGDAIIHAYSGQNMGDMDPHIFAVAEEAYKQMARNSKNQSIIVSGESGAGKTVSARYAMRYFATVSKSSSKTRVEDKVLASNPITEAIGNAKTTRNDNSSRFGKYTEISFDRRNQIIGANMRTYLLEKSRVVFQSENERNYHIFYQLCASADQPEFKNFRLLSADEFRYTSMGSNTYIDGVDDKADMNETRRTFSLLGLKEDFQMDVFKVLAGILHLGNVQVKAVSDDKSSVSSSDRHLAQFCELLDVSAESVARWLCSRKIVLVSETVVKPMPRDRAINARDALAKQIYAHLFDCVIDKINRALKFPGKQHSFIGVLDIYGFETFEVNSFEQFCINYANEKLQQQFNLHVFKLEQEEYMKEDIPWTLIDFYDNQPVIDLIEAKMGILDLLDEECLFPQGTDQNWLQKLYNNYVDKNPLFEKPRMSNESFVIQHFADKVEYKSKGFLEKNRDTMYEELVDVMRASKFHLLANFFQEEEPTSPFSKSIKIKPARSGLKPANKQLRTTVGNKFRSSLYLLMETLNATTPHYVRCIKPNEDKLPFEYDSKRVVQQLRACGVLETIHISAQSYPSRWTYIEFYSRYSILMTQQELALSDKKQTCKIVLQRLIQDSNQYKFGRTKIFFRAGQVAYLEKLRSDRLRGACITVQKHLRGWIQRKRFLQMREAAIVIQQYVRGKRKVRQTVTAATLKRVWAAIIIQKYCRGFLVRRVYQLVQVATVTIQAYARGWRARTQYKKLVEEQKAVILQKYARAWLARRRFQSIRRLVLNVQLSYRVQQLKKKLEDQFLKKILVLSQCTLQPQNKENHGLLERLTGLASAHAQDVDKLQKLEADLKKMAAEKKTFEEGMKRSKAEANQVFIVTLSPCLLNVLCSLQKLIIQLEAQNNNLLQEKQNQEKKLQDSIKEMKGRTCVVRRENSWKSLKERRDKEIALLEFGRNLSIKYTICSSEMTIVCNMLQCDHHSSTDIGLQCLVILENSFEIQKEEYEKRIETMKEEIKCLREEKIMLQEQAQEELQVKSHLQQQVGELAKQLKVGQQVGQLAKEAKIYLGYFFDRNLVGINIPIHSLSEFLNSFFYQVIPELKKEIGNLETEKQHLDRQKKEHMNEARVYQILPQRMRGIMNSTPYVLTAKISEVTKQLLSGIKEEEFLSRILLTPCTNTLPSMSRLTTEDLEQINEEGELLFAYEGLRKATRVIETHAQAQKESYESEIESLRYQIEHFQNENNELQKLFQEGNNVNASIQQEVARLASENMVIPQYKQQISELQRQKHDLEDRLKDQAIEMRGELNCLFFSLNERLLQLQLEAYKKEKQELLDRIAEKEDENTQLKKQYQTESETKNRLRQEASRLIAENMDFEEQIDLKDRLIKKLQNQIQGLQSLEKGTLAKLCVSILIPFFCFFGLKVNPVQAPPVPKEYLGMLEFKQEDEGKIINNLILELKPRGVVVNMIPGLPAHLLFMCIRHADYLNDATKLKSLMNAIISGIKLVIKDHQEDFEMLSFWLSNSCHMLNCLKQYSGEEELMKHNTPRQNKNCLRNFDLSEHRQIFSDLAIRIYHQFISVMENCLMPMIVPGMLEHESLQGISSMKPTGLRKRSTSIYEDMEVYTISSILQQLSYFHSTMCQHGMDAELMKQAVKQLFFLIGAVTLNSIFLRKDMCSCRKGMQIRCNISYLEEWLKEKSMQNCNAVDTMEPLSQTAWLLQVNKSTDDDAKEICERCSGLSAVQIVKILNSYTPIDDFEKRVAPSFVRKVQSLLQGREGTSQLMLDTKYRFQVTFPFSPSPQALEMIQIPSSLKLGFLTRI
ncbi:MYO5C protein, partial [Atractosteus spatula]|nr:MYO5C protein [Atractosteus spatula]